MSVPTTTAGLMLTKEALLQVYDEAQARFPHECCGVFVKGPDGTPCVHPITNIHADPEAHFLMDPYGLMELCYDGNLAGVVGLFHSHCGKLPHPSTADLALIDLTKMPHLIVSVGTPRLSLWASWLHHALTFGYLEDYPYYGGH